MAAKDQMNDGVAPSTETLTPKALAAKKRAAKKKSELATAKHGEPEAVAVGNDSATKPVDEPSKPRRKAKEAAIEKKVWKVDGGARKRAATTSEDPGQPRPSKTKQRRDGESGAGEEEGDTVQIVRGASKNVTASRKQQEAAPPKFRQLKNTKPPKPAVASKLSIGAAMELSDVEGSIADEDASDQKSDGTGHDASEVSSDDEILRSIAQDPKKLKEALANEIPSVTQTSQNKVTKKPAQSTTPSRSARKSGSKRHEARQALERPKVIVDSETVKAEPPDSEAKTTRTGLPIFRSRDGPWHPTTDLVYTDGVPLLKTQAPHIQKVLQGAISIFLRDILFECAFPKFTDKRQMSVKALCESAKDCGEHEMADRLRWDPSYGPDLAHIPEGRLSGFLNNLKKTVHPLVVAAYRLEKDRVRDPEKKCATLVTNFLSHDNFIYPHTPSMKPIRFEPFHHPVFFDALRATVFNGPSSFGARYKDHFVSIVDDLEHEPEIPSGLLALTTTIASAGAHLVSYTDVYQQIWSVLDDWRDGKGPANPDKVSMGAPAHRFVYSKFEQFLTEICTTDRESGPLKYHTVTAKLYQEARLIKIYDGPGETSQTEDGMTREHLQSFKNLDFDGMAVGLRGGGETSSDEDQEDA